MDFGTLPPEINSRRMYSGPGSGPMMEAVTAWERLATRLYSVVADYRAVTSKLAAGWEGPGVAAMTQAATPYIEWLNATAVQVEQAAKQAAAAAGAYESAFAATVPPPVINVNRAQHRLLATRNCLGQTGPAIADTDAEYERMWTQDARAMYTYAAASADASTVTPFESPPPTTAVPARQGAAVARASSSFTIAAAPEMVSAGCQVISAIPEGLQALSSSPLTTLDMSLSSVSPSLSKLSSLSAPLDFAISYLNCLNKAVALRTLLPKPGGAGGTSITARFGRATSIGTLSVPQAWVKSSTVSVVPERLLRGWVCEPIRLVEVNEPPRWPLSH
jgi:PPE-repeat protein